MRSHLLALPLAALLPHCGGPLPGAETPVQVASGAGAPDASAAGDATSRPARAFHTITVSACARDAEECRRAKANGGEGSYRMALGGGIGMLRSREQVVADLYRELRDRTAVGTRLAAHPRHLELGPLEGGSPAGGSGGAGASAASDSPATDELIHAARELVDAVDAQGEVTLDVDHGGIACKLSLGLEGADASARRCLIEDTTRGGQKDTGGRRRTGDTSGK